VLKIKAFAFANNCFHHENLTDFSTLNGNNNAGDNYTYTVTSASAYAVASVSSDLIENTLNNSEINIEIFNDSFVDLLVADFVER